MAYWPVKVVFDNEQAPAEKPLLPLGGNGKLFKLALPVDDPLLVKIVIPDTKTLEPIFVTLEVL